MKNSQRREWMDENDKIVNIGLEIKMTCKFAFLI